MIMQNFNKFLTVLILLLFIFASIFGVMVYWVLWPYDTIKIHSIEVLNANKTVQQEGCLAYHIKWTKYTDKQGRINRYFVNGQKHRLEADGDADGFLGSAPIGPGETDIFLKISKDTPAGKGKMQWTATYPMNPLRNVTVGINPPIYSDEFIVTVKPVKGIKGDRGKTGDRGEKGDTGKTGKDFWGK